MWWIILWIVIGLSLVLSACGTGSPVAIHPPQPQDPAVQRLDAPTSSLIDVPLPGFIPRQVNLLEKELFSTPIPILSSNYAIAWTGSFTDGRILAQSRSDKPITLDPCTIRAAGDHTLFASAYNPLDFFLFFPLAEAAVPITIDPGCGFRIEYELSPQLPIPTPQPPTEPCEGSPSSLPEPGFEHGIPYRLVIKLFDGQTDAEITNLEDFEFAVIPKNADSVVMGGSRNMWTVELTRDLGTLELELKVSNRETEQMETAPVKREDVCDNRAMDPPDCFGEDGDESEDCDPPPPPCAGDCPPPPPVPPAPLPPPPIPPCNGCGRTRSWGDPHNTTFDGLYYDFQAVGEFVYAKSIDDELEVQVRQRPTTFRAPVAINSAVAARMGSHRVAIYSRQPQEETLWIDGAPINMPSVGVHYVDNQKEYMVFREGIKYTLVWPTQESLEANVNQGFLGGYINITLSVLPSRKGKIVGLSGNFDENPENDIATRTGIILSPERNRAYDFTTFYNSFGNSWRIAQKESLFDYSSGETTETFTDLSYPPAPRLKPSTEILRQSEQSCLTRGITDEILLRACVFDISTVDQAIADGETVSNEIRQSLLSSVKQVSDRATQTNSVPKIAVDVQGSLPLSSMDPNLVTTLRRVTGIENGPIFPSDLSSVTQLQINQSVRSLQGLETAPLDNLTDLSIQGGVSLTSLQGLPLSLPQLRRLYISSVISRRSGVGLTTLEGLPIELPALEIMFLSGSSRMTNLIGFPQSLPQLRELSLSSNSGLTTLEGLSTELPVLESIRLDGNLVLTNLIGLPRFLPQLRELYILNHSRLTSLEGLPAELPVLENMLLRWNSQLTNLIGFPQSLPQLERINLESNSALTTLEGFPAELPVLSSLTLSGNSSLTELLAIGELPNLTYINIWPQPSTLLCPVRDRINPQARVNWIPISDLQCP